MPASFQKILSSRVFKFIVGENVDGIPTEFLVHEEAIAQLSKPLDALMKGNMAESQAGCTIWADVSKETFERFAQFAYTGDYSIPNMEKRYGFASQKEAVKDDSLSDSPHKLDEGWRKTVVEWEDAVRHSSTSKKGKKKKAKPADPLEVSMTAADLWGAIPITKRDESPEHHSHIHSEDFQSLSFPLLAPRNKYDETCEPAEHFDPDKSYTEVFLSHASLYFLGDQQLIDSLKALALFKLHKTLCVFQLDDGNAEDIIALATYAYSEEDGAGALDKGIGSLRSLVCHYMATNAVVLSTNAEFMDLLGNGGQLVKDFFKYEVQRIS